MEWESLEVEGVGRGSEELRRGLCRLIRKQSSGQLSESFKEGEREGGGR